MMQEVRGGDAVTPSNHPFTFPPRGQQRPPGVNRGRGASRKPHEITEE